MTSWMSVAAVSDAAVTAMSDTFFLSGLDRWPWPEIRSRTWTGRFDGRRTPTTVAVRIANSIRETPNVRGWARAFAQLIATPPYRQAFPALGRRRPGNQRLTVCAASWSAAPSMPQPGPTTTTLLCCASTTTAIAAAGLPSKVADITPLTADGLMALAARHLE